MTRAVLDANVLVAAALSPNGAPAACLRAHADGRFDLIVSERLLGEVETVLARPKLRRYLALDEAGRFASALRRVATLCVDPEVAPSSRSPDPQDDYLIVLAESQSAHVLVSGDRHLLGSTVQGLRILAPRPFLALLPT